MRWKSIEGFSLYEVSETGLVRRIKHTRDQVSKDGNLYTMSVSEKLMNPFDNGTGYLQVNLTGDIEKRRKRYIHVLVAKAFVPKPGVDYEVDHKDENKKNNEYQNLHWVTRKENMAKMLVSNPHVLDNLLHYLKGEV